MDPSKRHSRSRLPVRASNARDTRRPTSIDRLTTYSNPSSGMKRSRSACVTPSFTPVRTPSASRFICTPGTSKMLTSERAPNENKIWYQTQSKKILEYLEKQDFLGSDFIRKGGLKSMTIKEFVAIISHLLKPLIGNRLTLAAKTYVDDIVKWLSKIDYPYSINKSWLKTPSAPHSLNHIILLLSWLVDLQIDTAKNVEEFECADNLVLLNDDFPDTIYLKNFKQSVSDGFILWDNESKEFDEMIEKLEDDYVYRKINVENMRKAKEDISIMKAKIAKANVSIKQYTKNKKEHSKINNDCKMIQENIQKVSNSIKLKKSELQILKSGCSENESILKDLTIQEQDLLRQLKNQKLSVKDRDEILKKISYKMALIESLKDANAEFQPTGNDKQMQLASLVRTKLNCIQKLNSYLYKLSSTFQSVYNIPVEQLEIKDFNDENIVEKIADLAEFQKSFKLTNQQHTDQLKKKIFDSKLILTDRKAKYSVIENKLKVAEKEMQNNLAKLEEVKIQLANTEIELNNKIPEMEKNLESITKTLETDTANFLKNKQNLEMLEQTKQDLMCDALQKMSENVENKEKALEDAIKKLEEFKKSSL